LYECNENFIALDKELNYIMNYLRIEEVRKGEDANFNFHLPDLSQSSFDKSLKIAPLLITPFLENAFKYLSNHSNNEKNIVDFRLDIESGDILRLKLMNTYEKSHLPSISKGGGIGLENVQRRLSLLYPDDKHSLVIRDDGTSYSVDLIIKLNEED